MKIFFVTLFLLLEIVAQADQWVQVASMQVARSGHSIFTIGNDAFSGCGLYNVNLKKDFWKYNSITDSWTQVADLPAADRTEAFSFSINGIGYVGGGHAWTAILKDFWAYDPGSNSWSQKADFPGPRSGAVTFVLGDSGYVATGTTPIFTRDLWAYNPSADIWTQKANLPGSSRFDAVGFSIDGNGYVGTGKDSADNLLDDFYEYDPFSDSWFAKTSFGGGVISQGSAFAMNHAGYIILSHSSAIETWMYTPATDSWSHKTDLPSAPRWNHSSFEIGNFGYVCGGDTLVVSNGTVPGVCCWKYIPDTLNAIDEINYFLNFNVVYSHSQQQIEIRSDYRVPVTIYSDDGKLVANADAVPGNYRVDVTKWASGIYYVRAEMKQQMVVRKIIKY